MTRASLNIEVDNDRLVRAMTRAPKLLKKNMSNAILRIIQTLARTMKTDGPKATSQMVNSIQAELVNALYGRVFAGVNYAGHVNDGTAPSGKMPPLDDILAWIRVKNIEPANPEMDERDLAFVISRSIAAKGTPRQPFVDRARDRHTQEATMRANAAITQTLEALAA